MKYKQTAERTKLYETAVSTRVNNDMQNVTHRKQQNSRTVILVRQKFANVNVLLKKSFIFWMKHFLT